MPRIYVESFPVPDEAIDLNEHVNNLVYLRWMQDVATRHSAAQGWPIARYLDLGSAWVVRSHTIEYLRPVRRREELTLLTWVVDMRRQTSRRRYLFWRAVDHTVIARAETLWVFVDSATGRLAAIPEALTAAFELVPSDQEVFAMLTPTLEGGRT